MRCAGCQRDLDVGDQYIEDTASGFTGAGASPEIDGLIGEILGSGRGSKLVYCQDCTEDGGRYKLETVYGDEDIASDEKLQGGEVDA